MVTNSSILYDVVRTYKVDGIVYQPTGWFGCQLESIEWKKPKISFDNHRDILGYRFIPVDVTSYPIFRHKIHWCLEEIVHNRNGNSEKQCAFIREFLHKLRNP